ncbi:MAG: hypothetical protein E3J69_11215 [Anaerolineales bacterium]|nr:MAG: hypothetical protein E3J69_11215 [Anaerolineales bacterium]
MTLRYYRYIASVIVVITLSGCMPSRIVDEEQGHSITLKASATTNPTATRVPTTLTPTITQLQSPTITSAPLLTPALLGQDSMMIFIGETIPDGTNFKSGETFSKTWTIKNGGTLTWDEGFILIRTSSTPLNEFLGGPERIPITKEVKPGETFQIGVDLVAPTQNGRYTVFYQLQDETGSLVPNSQVWVTITVGTIPLVESGGITARFVAASMQAGEFSVDFCMQLPDGRQWYPWDVILIANQQQYSPSGSRIDPYGAMTANKCFSFSFPVSVSSGISYQLSIGKVELPPEVNQAENCAYAQATLRAAYSGLDFTCTGPGFWYANLVLPTGMTKEQADQLILDAMSSSIYGPWLLNGSAP